MTKLKHRVKWALNNPTQATKAAVHHAKIVARYGAVDYIKMAKFGRSHQFGCGIRTAYSDIEIQKGKYHSLVVLLVGEVVDRDKVELLIKIQQEQRCHFFASQTTAEVLISSANDSRIATVVSCLGSPATVDMATLRSTMIQTHSGNDVLIIDLNEDIPDSRFFTTIQFVAHDYHRDAKLITPAYLYKDKKYSGLEFNRAKKTFNWFKESQNDIGQLDVSRYSLNGHWHGLYLRADVITDIDLSSKETPVGIADSVSYLIFRAWQQNVRTLVYAPISLKIHKLPKFTTEEYHKKWLLDRHLKNNEGKTRVIYVLNATSVSGGIKTVFEHINGLLKRNFEVELWSLQGQPEWMDLNVKVKTFYSYQDIEVALRNEDAIKVATWWETSQPVWVASVNHGVGVNFIQEFEPWFYPDDVAAQAAVASTYRKELVCMTTSSYNMKELDSVGLTDIPLIPVGYDGDIYYRDTSITRKSDTMLAVGRSFFQKNFEFTKQAWLSLGNKRPNLELFGSEPDIITDKKAHYTVRPSNEEVNALYNTATFLVQTSRHEGFCLPIIEAMAAGCPVICTDAHGNRDFSIDGETCIMVDHDNIQQLADAIARVQGDKNLQERLRSNGLAMAKKYEWSTIIDRVADLYTSLS